jgi:hypothetical protein
VTRRFGWLDIPVLAGLLLAGGWFWLHGTGGKGQRAEAWVDGKRVAWWELTGALARDTVMTGIGPLVVEHGMGRVRIVEAACPNHICMKQGSASRANERLVCAPSRTVVVILGAPGNAGKEFDAIQ